MLKQIRDVRTENDSYRGIAQGELPAGGASRATGRWSPRRLRVWREGYEALRPSRVVAERKATGRRAQPEPSCVMLRMRTSMTERWTALWTS